MGDLTPGRDIRAGVVFVHGFLSSADTWARFLRLVNEDLELAVVPFTFQYRAPVVSSNPLRRIPNLNAVADSLRTYLSYDLADIPHLALVSHSQGGLVVQRMLAQTLADLDDDLLTRIRLVVMYAYPHAGPGLALSMRRRLSFWRKPLERELRPLHETVIETERTVLSQVVHKPERDITVKVYDGESDGVVTPQSARSVFADAGMVPGDHFSIIQPDTPTHRSYTVLKQDLRDMLTGIEASASRSAQVVDALLAVPGMTDPEFRRRLYAHLPTLVRDQLSHHDTPRIELVGVAATLTDYQHLAAWEALIAGLCELVPDQPAVADLIDILAAQGASVGRPEKAVTNLSDYFASTHRAATRSPAPGERDAELTTDSRRELVEAASTRNFTSRDMDIASDAFNEALDLLGPPPEPTRTGGSPVSPRTPVGAS